MAVDFVAANNTASTGDAPLDHFWSRLTTSRQKWELYRDEPGFKVAGAMLLAESGPAVFDSLHHYAVIMMKPEGWIDDLFPRVTRFLAGSGFQIVGSFRSRLTAIMIREIWRYQWNIAPVERIELSELLLSQGPTYGFLLHDLAPQDKVPASVRLARLKGPALPDRQRPGQLRHELRAPCRIVTYVHIPDEPADIIRDLSVLVDRREMVRLLCGTLDGPAPVPVDLARPADVARVDDALPAVGPIGGPTDSLWHRVRLMRAAYGEHVHDDRIPRSLWRDLVALCTEVSALPTPGRKRVEPLADLPS